MSNPDLNNENNDATLPYQPRRRNYYADHDQEEGYPQQPYQLLDDDVNSSRTASWSSPEEERLGQAAHPTQQAMYNNTTNSASFVSPALQHRAAKKGGLRTGAIIVLTLVIALVFGVGLFAGWEFGRNSTAPVVVNGGSPLQTGSNLRVAIPASNGSNSEAIREAVIANVRPAVVQINVTTRNGAALGSGVIVDKRGYIVTNNHVVQGAQRIDEVVLSDGTKVNNARVVGSDPADDLAVIKIDPPANMIAITIGDSSGIRVGQEVLAIGNPLGNTQTVTSGIVSALGRNVSEQSGVTIPNAIQTDAAINPGNSGGALVDLQGNLVGIPTLTAIDPEFNAPANGVGFAIPSNRVAFVVPQIIQDGKVTHTGRSAIGIRPAPVDAMVKAQDNLSVDHGILITALVHGGAAEKAGLQAGDVIVSIDNKATDSIPSLEDALIAKNPGDQASVKVYRGNQQLTVTVTLGELQAS